MKRTFQVTTHAAEETMAAGRRVGAGVRAGQIICLYGDLGSGKTTFVRGLAQGMRLDPHQVHSPTFTFMNVYSSSKKSVRPLFHFDLYRVENIEEIFALDYEEYFYGEGVCVVEWAERLGPLQPKNFLSVRLAHKSEDKRILRISARGGCVPALAGRAAGQEKGFA